MAKIVLCLSSGCLLLMSSCASIITGTSQIVPVESDPPGAQIAMDGMGVGVTPAQITVKRGSDHVLAISREGFETTTVMLGKKFNGWYIGNLVIGGLVGLIIDLADGAYMWVEPEFVKVVLKRKGIP